MYSKKIADCCISKLDLGHIKLDIGHYSSSLPLCIIDAVMWNFNKKVQRIHNKNKSSLNMLRR